AEVSSLTYARDEQRAEAQEERRRRHAHRGPLVPGEPARLDGRRDEVERPDAAGRGDGQGELRHALLPLAQRVEVPPRALGVRRRRHWRAQHGERVGELGGGVAREPDGVALAPAGHRKAPAYLAGQRRRVPGGQAPAPEEIGAPQEQKIDGVARAAEPPAALTRRGVDEGLE